ncbi:LLM class flavin-dependent oxidoreductase [Pseudonocardia alaniniphila]|uniref:LLM class flavin-dependent oxidoreductase n=1 Tax=Pseudonocardia alaniniphila TaxID=75291 RepID=UPI00363D5FC0
MAQGTYLAVEVSGAGRHPAAWRRPDARPEELLTAAYHVELTRLAAGADFVAVPDSLVPPSGDPDLVPIRLDAVAIAARVAPVVPGVGLVPAVTVTHTEPFHISKAIATLDLVSSGRAGWEPLVSRTPAEAELFGRKPAAPAADLWRETADVIEVVAALWDSWEDDAVIRDVATGRYVDRDKLHYIDFAGEFFSVKGPSITPRSPQAHPLVVLRGDEPEALGVAAARADVVRVPAADLAAAHTARERVRAAVAAAGRNPDDVAVLLDVEVLLDSDAAGARRALDALDAHRELAASSLRVVDTADALVDVIAEAVSGGAADGVTAVPLALPSGVQAIAADVVPRLAERGLRPPVPPGATLRERFGLSRPANRYAEVNA